MTDTLPTTPAHVFVPPPPFNFDPSTGTPIEYSPEGHPIHVVQHIVAPQLPPGVHSYDPYTGKPLDLHGNPVPGVQNPWGQHVFESRLADRQGVDPSGHVIAQRPDYDTETGLPIRYDAHGNPMIPHVDVEKPPGVDHYDAETGEPVDAHGNPVPGVENPHQRPVYDEATGLPIHYDDDGVGQIIQIGVVKPPGVDHYDRKTGEPLDVHGNPVPDARNPHQLPEHCPPDPHQPHEPLPNFDPVTGVPIEYDHDGNPHPITQLEPHHPPHVAGFDPVTGEPLDADGNVVEDYDNPLGEHDFQTRLEDREGVDPTGHVIAQRPMYDTETGKPIFYDGHGQATIPLRGQPRPEGVDSFDPDTGDPLDAQGRPLPDVRNPNKRPDYDTDNGLPIDYDENGHPIPTPPIIVTIPPGVASYDPDTGRPLDRDGEPLDVTNPFQRPEDRNEPGEGDVPENQPNTPFDALEIGEMEDRQPQIDPDGATWQPDTVVYGPDGQPVPQPSPSDYLPEDPTLVAPPVDGLPTTPEPTGTSLGTQPWPGTSPFEGEGSPIPGETPATLPGQPAPPDGAQTTLPVDTPFDGAPADTDASTPFQGDARRDEPQIPEQDSVGQEDLPPATRETEASTEAGTESATEPSTDRDADAGHESDASSSGTDAGSGSASSDADLSGVT